MNARRSLGRLGIVAALVAVALPAQAGPLRCTDAAIAGGTITVQVGSNDRQIVLQNPVTGAETRHDVPPGKNVTLTVPSVQVGTRLVVRAGRGINAHRLEIEVVAPPS